MFTSLTLARARETAARVVISGTTSNCTSRFLASSHIARAVQLIRLHLLRANMHSLPALLAVTLAERLS